MSYALFQIQCLAIEITLALAEREYLRYPPGTIIDGVNVGGQFAVGKKSGDSSPTPQIVSAPKSLMGNVLESLESAFSKTKDLEAKVTKTVAEISKNIVAQYPIDQTPLQLPGASFAQKLQAAAAQYFSIEDNLPITNPSEQNKLLGIAIKTAIPLAVALALTVGVEVAIGMLIGQTIGEAIVGSALVFGVSSATDKVLDIAKVDNPIVRASLQIVAGLATGGLVARSIKVAAINAKNITEVAEKLIKEATLTPGLLNKILDPHRMATVLEKNKIDSKKVLDALYREVARDKRIGKVSLHPFSKRLNEYVELASSKNNLNNVAIEWRKGVIDAELKYGETINKISLVPIEDVTLRAEKKLLTEFLNVVKQGKENKSIIQKVDQDFIDKYGYLFGENANFVLEGKRKFRGFQVDSKRRVDEVTDAVLEASQLAGVDLGKIAVGNIEGPAYEKSGLGRAFARTFFGKNAGLKYINAGLASDSRNVGFHETGHFIEDAKGFAKYSVDLVKDRATKQKPLIIDGQEVPYAGFLSPYSGKIYSSPNRPNRATEVISTGLETLTSFSRLRRITREDPDHLRFTLFALDSAVK